MIIFQKRIIVPTGMKKILLGTRVIYQRVDKQQLTTPIIQLLEIQDEFQKLSTPVIQLVQETETTRLATPVIALVEESDMMKLTTPTIHVEVVESMQKLITPLIELVEVQAPKLETPTIKYGYDKPVATLNGDILTFTEVDGVDRYHLLGSKGGGLYTLDTTYPGRELSFNVKEALIDFGWDENREYEVEVSASAYIQGKTVISYSNTLIYILGEGEQPDPDVPVEPELPKLFTPVIKVEVIEDTPVEPDEPETIKLSTPVIEIEVVQAEPAIPDEPEPPVTVKLVTPQIRLEVMEDEQPEPDVPIEPEIPKLIAPVIRIEEVLPPKLGKPNIEKYDDRGYIILDSPTLSLNGDILSWKPVQTMYTEGDYQQKYNIMFWDEARDKVESTMGSMGNRYGGYTVLDTSVNLRDSLSLQPSGVYTVEVRAELSGFDRNIWSETSSLKYQLVNNHNPLSKPVATLVGDILTFTEVEGRGMSCTYRVMENRPSATRSAYGSIHIYSTYGANFDTAEAKVNLKEALAASSSTNRDGEYWIRVEVLSYVDGTAYYNYSDKLVYTFVRD